MRLEDIQQAYAKAIYANEPTALEALIHESPEFSTEQRVGVYQNNTIGGLKTALRNTFPVCETLVGKDYFGQLAQHHVKLNPSADRNLEEYGANFSETLATLIEQRPELAELAYLSDVAKLEWIQHQTYFANDRQSFDLEAFAALAPEVQTQVTFILADDVSLIDSPYPIYDIWHSHQQSIELEITHTEHNYLLIQRPQWKVTATLIDGAYYALLKAISDSKTLIELTVFLAESPVDLATLIEQKIITSF
ncbi:MAG: Unknown protein, partial [uncultured Thiotrichaceae bacterium]